MKELNRKFKVWDELSRKWDNIQWSASFDPDGTINVAPFHKIVQFTGLKDKNSIEIYEGDILEIKTESGMIERFTCEWGIHQRSMASGWEVEIPSFAFVNSEKFPTYPIVNNYLNGRDLDIIEVIGNIYENPEFLN